MRFVRHDDETLDRLERVGEPLQQRYEGEVDEDVRILGVVDDVDELLGEQARIDGVQDGAHARHAVVELEMPVAVPRHGADAIARVDAERGERVGDPLRARLGVTIGVAVNRSFDRARHDLGVAVIQRRVIDDRRDQQRPVHHQSQHAILLCVLSERRHGRPRQGKTTKNTGSLCD